MSHPDPERVKLALFGIHETCLELAAEGCGPTEVATALASMLGVVTASCREEYAEEAENVVIEIFEESLATHRARFAAYRRVGEAGMPNQEGHA